MSNQNNKHQLGNRKVDNPGRKICLIILENLVWFIAAIVFIIFGLVAKGFFTLRVLFFILYISSPVGLLVLSQALCLLSGNFDVSIAQIAGLSVLIIGLIIGREFPGMIPVPIAIALVPILGGILGAINGYFVGFLQVNSFLVTLSFYLIYQFSSYYILTLPITGYYLPAAFLALGGQRLGPIYIVFYVFLAVSLILHFMLKFTGLGTKIYAVGSDMEASRTLGINNQTIIFWVYVVSGIIAGLAGLAYAGFVGAITNSLANGEVFWSFAGAIMGGISMKGGRGKILGALGGAFLLGIIGAGVVVLDITPTLRDVVKGFVVLSSVIIGKYRYYWIDRILMSEERY